MSALDFYRELGVKLPSRNDRANTVVCCFVNPAAHKAADRHPSCSVNVESGAFNCHGCGAHGGPYDAALALGRTPADAMAMLERHGLVDGDRRRDGARLRSGQRRLRATEADVERYREALLSNEEILESLRRQRAWTREALSRLGVGADMSARRLTIPVRESSGALVGLLRYAKRRNERKMVADEGSKRELLPAPETIAGDELVLLVEGEPDALTATSLGLAAVAIPGASSWQDEWGSRFAGRRVVLCPDADAQGRELMQRVANGLVGVASEVRLLDLAPEREDGFDLSDFVREQLSDRRDDEALGDVRERLLELVAGTSPIVAEEPEPEAVAALLDEVREFLRAFVVLSSEQADAGALWVGHSHALEAFDATPYLVFLSPEKRSGKTTALKVLEQLVSRPWRVVTPTEAVVFRKIEADRPTLLLDETDAIFGPKAGANHEALRALLNAGNERGTTVPRCVGKSQTLVDFGVFCAKALAGIGGLPDTVTDRAIVIRLHRKAPAERARRFLRREVREEAAPLRERLARWARAAVHTLREMRPDLPAYLDDRAADAWEPLLAIADLAGGDWPERARRAARVLSSGEAREDNSLGVRLLVDVRQVFERVGADRLPTAALIEELTKDEEAPWGDWRGKPITPKALGNLLRRYGIRARDIRFTTGVAKGYYRAQFEDAWDRYTPSLSQESGFEAQHPRHRLNHAGLGAVAEAQHNAFVPNAKSAANTLGKPDVADVADKPPEPATTSGRKASFDFSADSPPALAEEVVASRDSAAAERVADRFCDHYADGEHCEATRTCARIAEAAERRDPREAAVLAAAAQELVDAGIARCVENGEEPNAWPEDLDARPLPPPPTPGCVPAVGNHGFVSFLRARRDAGHLTRDEFLERLRTHRLVGPIIQGTLEEPR